MKRGALVLTTIAGLAGFPRRPGALSTGELVRVRPAAAGCVAPSSAVPSGMANASASTLQGSKLGDATWNFAAGERAHRPTRTATSTCAAARSARAPTSTTVSTACGELRNVTARFPLDPGVHRAIAARSARQCRRRPQTRGARPTARASRSSQGTLELHDLRQVGAQPLELGSYRLTFDGAAQADGTSVGQAARSRRAVRGRWHASR